VIPVMNWSIKEFPHCIVSWLAPLICYKLLNCDGNQLYMWKQTKKRKIQKLSFANWINRHDLHQVPQLPLIDTIIWNSFLRCISYLEVYQPMKRKLSLLQRQAEAVVIFFAHQKIYNIRTPAHHFRLRLRVKHPTAVNGFGHWIF
jgi:hypothetical protein